MTPPAKAAALKGLGKHHKDPGRHPPLAVPFDSVVPGSTTAGNKRAVGDLEGSTVVSGSEVFMAGRTAAASADTAAVASSTMPADAACSKGCWAGNTTGAGGSLGAQEVCVHGAVSAHDLELRPGMPHERLEALRSRLAVLLEMEAAAATR